MSDERATAHVADHARGAASVAVGAASCSCSRPMRAWATGSVAMLGSLADTALDLIASLVTLFGVRVAAHAGRPRASLRPRQGRGAGRAGPGRADHRISALGIGWRAVDRLLQRRARPPMPNMASPSRSSRSSRRSRCSPTSARVIRRTGSVAIRTDNVHYQSDLLLNLSVIAALVLDQYARLRRRRSAVRHRHRRLADLGRLARVEPCGRPADGPRMARGEAACASSPSPRAIPSCAGHPRPAHPHQRRPRFRPVPHLGRPGR